VEVLLRAVESLHEKRFPFALSIAGRGPELDRLEKRFKRLPNVSIFNGFVPPNQIMKDIQSAECVVLPYLSATQSGVLAAAYAGHRYVIASSIGGLSDVVVHRRNGLLIPAGDPEALAHAIQLLGNDTFLRNSLLRGARATAEGQLNWSKIAQGLSAEFDSLRNIALKRT
jgi:glycosyltransferase involved in cell wall biosynthesis